MNRYGSISGVGTSVLYIFFNNITILQISVEELPIIKSEAIEVDDCFAPDPLELESNESYVSKSESLQKNINAEVNERDVSTLNSVLLESTQNVLSAVPISLDGEVHVEKDQNYLSNCANFPLKSIDNTQDIGKEVDNKPTKTLLCVSLTRISGSECPQKSARELASGTDDVIK